MSIRSTGSCVVCLIAIALGSAAQGQPASQGEAETPTTRPAEAAARARGLYLIGSMPPAIHLLQLADTENRGFSQFDQTLREAGVELEEQRDTDVTIDAETLAPYRLLVLSSNNRRFTKDEADALRVWVEAGGGVVAFSDSAFGGTPKQLGNTAGLDSDNDLLSQFGLQFLRDNGAGVFTIRQWEADHPLNANNKNEGIVFRGEGVSLIRVTEPAVMLARLQAGGTKGTVRLNNEDGPIQPNDAAVAVAIVGKGRVVGTFDRNTFWNAGEGTRLSEVDNRKYAQTLFRWAAGLEQD